MAICNDMFDLSRLPADALEAKADAFFGKGTPPEELLATMAAVTASIKKEAPSSSEQHKLDNLFDKTCRMTV